MQAPVDYPIDDPARNDAFSVDELIYAAQLDRQVNEEPDPEEMVRVARAGFRSVHDNTASDKPAIQSFAAVAQSLLASERAGAASEALSRWSRAIR